MVIFLILWIISIVISFASTVLRKYERITGFISLIFLAIIQGNPNYDYGDAIVYLHDYLFQTHQFEKGYNLITNFFSQYIDYQYFRLLSSFVFLLSIGFIVCKFTKYLSAFTLFYSIGAFPNDVQQVRNQMATVFLVLAGLALCKISKKSIAFLFSIALIYMASLFHSIALIFVLLPFLFYFKNLESRLSQISLFGLLLLVVFKFLPISVINTFINSVLTKFGSRTDAGSNIINIYSFNVVPYRIWILLIILTFYAFYLIRGSKVLSVNRKISSIRQLEICSFVIWIIGLLLMTTSIEYIRILRIASVFLFVYSASCLEYVQQKQGSSLVIKTMLFSIVLLITQILIYYSSIDNFIKAMNF